MTDQEINEAVARKLGWTYHEDLKPVCWQVPPPGETYLHDLPDYCHSIAEAWEIVEWISKKSDQNQYDVIKIGFRLEHHTENSEDDWICQLPTVTIAPRYEEMNDGILVETDTAPMAICLAFLNMSEK